MAVDIGDALFSGFARPFINSFQARRRFVENLWDKDGNLLNQKQ